MPGYASPIRAQQPGGGARRFYMLWDDAVVVVTGSYPLAVRDPLVSALFGPAPGAASDAPTPDQPASRP